MSDDTYWQSGQEFYRSNGWPVWPNRHRELPSIQGNDEKPKGDLLENGFARLMLSHLDEAEKKTRPSLGDQSAQAKDLAAFSALKDAAWLIHHVAGWAIDHQRGLALQGLSFVPLQPSQTKTHSEYLARRAAVDSHEHEKAGAKVIPDELDPVTARRIMLNILVPMAGHLGIPTKMINALRALDFGEVMPELQKAETNAKQGLTERQLQLRAVAYVEYEVAKGRKKGLAQVEAAREFGVQHTDLGSDTVRGWEAQLREFFGDLEVDRTIAMARNCGKNYQHYRQKKLEGDQTADPEHFEEMQGLPSLREAGALYKRRGR